MTVRSRHRARRLVAAVTGGAEAFDPPGGPAASDRVGWFAAVWASLKLAVTGLLSPLWIPIVAGRAAANHRRARDLIDLFPVQLQAIAHHRRPTSPANRVGELPANTRMLIVSDLHRSVAGRLDWPERQGTKALYEHMLDHYGEAGWELCENGDIEDFWMVGGSAYGSAYDALRVAGAALSFFGRDGVLVETYRAHLDRVVANNEGVYRRLRERFVRHGRYHRTIGNHDDPLRRASVAERLRDHLGDVGPVDYLVLRGPDGEMVGIICHGHHTDGWCAPGRDYLGKLSSWFANTLIDVPGLETPEGLPPPSATHQVLAGEAPNRLITVHPTFGVSPNYDSLDEELLFRAMEPHPDGPWLLLGHTHSPVSEPRSRTGRVWRRYLNSGCGVTRDLITAIEWDGTGSEPTARLVAWTYRDDGAGGRVPTRLELCGGTQATLVPRGPDAVAAAAG